jgi:hypothetical protein
MRDRREEFADVPWQQGALLATRQVSRMPSDWRHAAHEREQRTLFAHFSPGDEGRGRVCLWQFSTPEECAAAVAQHNRKLRGAT